MPLRPVATAGEGEGVPAPLGELASLQRQISELHQLTGREQATHLTPAAASKLVGQQAVEIPVEAMEACTARVFSARMAGEVRKFLHTTHSALWIAPLNRPYHSQQ